MTTELEMLTTAKLLMTFLEQRVLRAEQERRDVISESVDLDSANQQFWYATDDNGLVEVKQDAPFCVEGMMLIGSPASTTNSVTDVSIEVLAGRNATVGLAPTAPGITQLSAIVVDVRVVPIEQFNPAYRQGDVIGVLPANTDYWHALAASWVIPKGSTLRCLFVNGDATVPTHPPNVVFSGYKVFT